MIDDRWTSEWKGLTDEEQRVEDEKLDFWWSFLFALILSATSEGLL